MSEDASHFADATLRCDRYARQTRFAPLGVDGQARLRASSAFVCGCGALGGVLADTLVRAGVGRVRIADRDFVEATNLHRQVLFDEEDAARRLPKAAAAAARLRRVNSEVAIEPYAVDVHAGNIAELCAGVDLIVDGTDNFETRFLLNDIAVQRGLPWVYGGVVGAQGQVMAILPGETPCLRCLMDECPAPGSMLTCESEGVLAPIVQVVASFEAIEAIKILSGRRAAVSPFLTVVDLWENRIRQVPLAGLRDRVDCPTCRRREFPWLTAKAGQESTILCGRNAVQLTPRGAGVSLEALADRWAALGKVVRNEFFVRLTLDSHELTVFADGRAIVSGTSDPAAARTLYARYVGL